MVVVTAVVATLGFKADRDARAEREATAIGHAKQAVRTLSSDIENRVQDMAGLFEASQSVTQREFRVFAEPVLKSSKASNLVYASVIPDRQRARFERARGTAIKEIGPNGEPRRAPHRAEYVIVTHGVGGTRGPKPLLEFDLTSDPSRASTIARAAKSDRPVATPPVRLGGTGTPGMAFYMPVFQPGSSARPIGYTIGVFRFDDLAAILKKALPGQSFELGYGTQRVIGLGVRNGDVGTSSVSIAGRTFTLSVGVPAGSAVGLGPLLVGLGLLLTAILTLLAAAISHAVQNARDLAASRERERDLAVAHEQISKAVADERFHRIFASAPVGMALIGLDGRYAQVNPAFARFVGRDQHALIGMRMSDLLPSGDVPTNTEAIAALTSGRESSYESDQRFRRPDGEIVWAALRESLLPAEDGQPELILAQVFDIGERRSFEEKLRYMADHDALTGLANRRAFNAAVIQQVAVVRRYGSEGALLLLDLDNFKQLNDLAGHQAGDELLVSVAQGLREALRDSDIAGRIGGDEFAVLLPKGDPEGVAVVAGRLVHAVRELGRDLAPHVAPVTCSVGVVVLGSDLPSLEHAMAEADAAMYEAKRAGGDRYVMAATPMLAETD